MPRVKVCLDLATVNRADLPSLLLQADNMITRFRDVIVKNPYVAIALSRIVAQVAYRLASERYQMSNDQICMVIELTIDELKTLHDHSARIIDELQLRWQHYRELLDTRQCRNITACEQRLAAIEAWIKIVEQLAEAYRNKRYSYLAREVR